MKIQQSHFTESKLEDLTVLGSRRVSGCKSVFHDTFFFFLPLLQCPHHFSYFYYDVWYDLQDHWPALLGQFPCKLVSDLLQMARFLCQLCWTFEIVLSSRRLHCFCGRKKCLHSIRKQECIRIFLSIEVLWSYVFMNISIYYSISKPLIEGDNFEKYC